VPPLSLGTMSALPPIPPVPSVSSAPAGSPAAPGATASGSPASASVPALSPAVTAPVAAVAVPDAVAVPAPSDRPVRSAAVVNMRIRALWARSGGALSPADQDRYQCLLEEWAAAVRADVVEAA
jgi:hypothetical protein